MSQWACPICGTLIAVRIYRKPLMGRVTVPPHKRMTQVAYRCQNGHICLANERKPGENLPHKLAA
jgi:hypothetical protein